MLIEIYIEALLVDEELADQVWEAQYSLTQKRSNYQTKLPRDLSAYTRLDYGSSLGLWCRFSC